MFEIINYNHQYDEQINELDENYWGVSETDKVSDDISKNDIVKIAVQDNRAIGLLHFKQIGDLINCYHVLVDEKYQHQKVATKLMEEAMLEINNRNIKTLVAHAVEHNGIIKAKKLLDKFGF